MIWFFSKREEDNEEVGAELVVPDDYPTVQQAIDAAEPGTVIMVRPGRYEENLDFCGKDVVLESSEPQNPEVVAQTVLTGGGSGAVVTFQGGETSAAELRGFTITEGHGSFDAEHTGGGIVVVNESGPLIERCVIVGNTSDLDGAGVYVDDSWPILQHNRIEENKAQGSGGGIHVGRDLATDDDFVPEPDQEAFAGFLDSAAIGSPSTATIGTGEAPGADEVAGESWSDASEQDAEERPRARIVQNTIIGNTALSGGGVHVADDAPTIEGNSVRENEARRGGGMTFWDSSKPVVGQNYIVGNSASDEGGGIMVEWGAAPAIGANTIRNNRSPRGAAIGVAENARPVIKGNRVSENESTRGAQLHFWQRELAVVEDNRVS